MLQQRLMLVSEHRRDKSWEQLGRLAERLNALSPLASLRRGYALLEDARQRPDEPPITRVASVQVGDTLRVRLHDGSLRCVVEAVDGRAEETEAKE